MGGAAQAVLVSTAAVWTRSCYALQQIAEQCPHCGCDAAAGGVPRVTPGLNPLQSVMLCCALHVCAGIRGKTLVINLPGKPKSIRETFDEVFKSIPYCIQLMGGPYIETHVAVVPAFRPPADKRTGKPPAAGEGQLQ